MIYPVSIPQDCWVRVGGTNLHVVAARDDEGTGDSLALAARVHEPGEVAAAVLALENSSDWALWQSQDDGCREVLTIL